MQRRAIAKEADDGVRRNDCYRSSNIELKQTNKDDIKVDDPFDSRLQDIMDTFGAFQLDRLRGRVFSINWCLSTATPFSFNRLRCFTTGRFCLAARQWRKEATPSLWHHQDDAADETEDVGHDSSHTAVIIPHMSG